MLTDLKTTIGYKCANCNRNNYKTITVFDINKKHSVSLDCACGQHLGDFKYKNANTYVLNMACCYCIDQHAIYINKKNVWQKKSLTYECPATSLVYVALGEAEEVHLEMHKADDDFEELLSTMQVMDDQQDTEESIMQILEKIQALDKAGKLFCTCGNHELFVDILDLQVVLMCGECGQTMTIHADNEEETDAFLIADEIALKGLKK